jgi:hypothetical protein
MSAARRRGSFQILAWAALIVLLGPTAGWAVNGDGGLSAVWAPKEFRFTYQGFTSKYSCDGLREKMRDILLQLGARKSDLKITDWGCAGSSGRPDPFPGVAVKMTVLVPADGAADPAQTVPAHWQPLALKLDRSSLSEAGECELVEQVKQKVLPLFSTRNIDLKSNCVPHQLTPGGTQLSAEVLAPDQNAAKVAGK